MCIFGQGISGVMASQGQYHRLENYDIEKELGHGSFATVYLGKDKVNIRPDIIYYLESFARKQVVKLP